MIKKQFIKIQNFVFPTALYLSLFGISFAQATCTINSKMALKDIIMGFVIGCVLSRVAYLIIASAIVVFVYGMFKFISSEGDDKQGGREFMFWGIVGIFVMISFWGLVAILQSTFKF